MLCLYHISLVMATKKKRPQQDCPSASGSKEEEEEYAQTVIYSASAFGDKHFKAFLDDAVLTASRWMHHGALFVEFYIRFCFERGKDPDVHKAQHIYALLQRGASDQTCKHKLVLVEEAKAAWKAICEENDIEPLAPTPALNNPMVYACKAFHSTLWHNYDREAFTQHVQAYVQATTGISKAGAKRVARFLALAHKLEDAKDREIWDAMRAKGWELANFRRKARLLRLKTRYRMLEEMEAAHASAGADDRVHGKSFGLVPHYRASRLFVRIDAAFLKSYARTRKLEVGDGGIGDYASIEALLKTCSRKIRRREGRAYPKTIMTDAVQVHVPWIRRGFVKQDEDAPSRAVAKDAMRGLVTTAAVREAWDDLKDRPVVAIDPGKANLVYRVDAVHKEVSVTRRQYYARIGARQHRARPPKAYRGLETRKKRRRGWKHPEVVRAEAALSEASLKGSNWETFQRSVGIHLREAETLRRFYGSRSAAHVRFTGAMRKQRVVDEIVNEVAPDPKTIVAYGSGYFGSRVACPGTADGPGPVKALRRHFAKRRLTALVDEFRTSKQCHACDGDVACPLRVRCVSKRYLRARPDAAATRTVRVHGLSHCPQCPSTWSRDANAARNILRAFLQTARDGTRPACLSRPRDPSEDKGGDTKRSPVIPPSEIGITVR